MTISRRDTILIAVLINIGLLAVLLMTAIRFEEEPRVDAGAFVEVHQQPAPPPPPVKIEPVVQEKKPVAPPVVEKTVVTKPRQKTVEVPPQPYIEITVQSGDSLDKLARKNGTMISKIKEMNNLTSDRLKIGQVLRVPAKQNITQVPKAKPTPKKVASNAVYHTVESGDNPWKIARKYKVNYGDILRLNDLDEVSARNLKPGDRIRVK